MRRATVPRLLVTTATREPRAASRAPLDYRPRTREGPDHLVVYAPLEGAVGLKHRLGLPVVASEVLELGHEWSAECRDPTGVGHNLTEVRLHRMPEAPQDELHGIGKRTVQVEKDAAPHR